MKVKLIIEIDVQWEEGTEPPAEESIGVIEEIVEGLLDWGREAKELVSEGTLNPTITVESVTTA